MQPIDVTEQVQEVVCQIATRQVRETIPLAGHTRARYSWGPDSKTANPNPCQWVADRSGEPISWGAAIRGV